MKKIILLVFLGIGNYIKEIHPFLSNSDFFLNLILGDVAAQEEVAGALPELVFPDSSRLAKIFLLPSHGCNQSSNSSNFRSDFDRYPVEGIKEENDGGKRLVHDNHHVLENSDGEGIDTNKRKKNVKGSSFSNFSRKKGFYRKMPSNFLTGLRVFSLLEIELCNNIKSKIPFLSYDDQSDAYRRLIIAMTYCYMGQTYFKNSEMFIEDKKYNQQEVLQPQQKYLTEEFVLKNQTAGFKYLPRYGKVFQVMVEFCYALIHQVPYPLTFSEKNYCAENFDYYY